MALPEYFRAALIETLDGLARAVRVHVHPLPSEPLVWVELNAAFAAMQAETPTGPQSTTAVAP